MMHYGGLMVAQEQLDYYLALQADPVELKKMIRTEAFKVLEEVREVIAGTTVVHHGGPMGDLEMWLEALGQLDMLLSLDHTTDPKEFNEDVLDMLHGMWCLEKEVPPFTWSDETARGFAMHFVRKYRQLPDKYAFRIFLNDKFRLTHFDRLREELDDLLDKVLAQE